VSRNPNVGLRRSHAIGPEHHVIAEDYKFVMRLRDEIYV